MATYFTADLHLDHIKVIDYEGRPFSSVEEMNETIITNWNSRISNVDQVYILGDFVWGKGEDANRFLKRLNGQKFLVRGNHDHFTKDNKFDKNLVGWVKDYHVLRKDDNIFVLMHYPIYVWDRKDHGSIHLYGHVHRDKSMHHPLLSSLGRAMNVGVDVTNFTPVSIEEVLHFIKTQEDSTTSST